MKRKPLSKKTRFEVFKRDKFTCQYCGDVAPNVVLHVDHIEPISRGGTDDILNLVTACSNCNGGKGPNRLSDDSVVKRQRKQMEISQERLEQLEMMHQWNKSLMSAEERSIEIVQELFYNNCEGKQWSFNSYGRQTAIKWICKFGLSEVLESVKIATRQYTKYDKEGHPILESLAVAFGKIGGICYNRKHDIDPYTYAGKRGRG